MQQWAPEAWAENFDNVGLLIGDPNLPINKVLVALDATDDVIHEAVANRYNCIITHHPLTYNPLKRVTTDDAIGRKILTLAKNDICLYAAHTNLDKAPGGVNDCLAHKLGILNTVPMAVDTANHHNGSTIGIGRIGELPKVITLLELSEIVKKTLNLSDIRYIGNLHTKIKKVAVCGGSGMSFWQEAKGCDVYITGDVKYSDALAVLDAGMCILDITHYGGENIIVEAIVKKLSDIAIRDAVDIEIHATAVNGQIFHSI